MSEQFSWTPTSVSSDLTLTSVSCSADGTIVSTSSYDGLIYTSNDSGSTFIASAPSAHWTNIAVASDSNPGNIIIAASTQTSGSLSNSGVWVFSSNVWNQTSLNFTCDYNSIALNEDGTVILVSDSTEYCLWVGSEKDISSFSKQTISNNNYFTSVASNSDGSLLAAVENNGNIYVGSSPTNNQYTWTKQVNQVSVSAYWSCIASNSSATILIACQYQDGNQNPGGIYIGSIPSSDQQYTWSKLSSDNGLPASANWISVTVDSTGQYMSAATASSIYISIDGGSSWTLQNATSISTITNFTSIKMNSYATASQGKIYAVTSSGNASSLYLGQPQLPDAPTEIFVSISPGSPGDVLISYTAPTNTGGTILSYTATAYNTIDPTTPAGYASGNSLFIIFTGLTVGQSYTFTVYATNSAGSGPPSVNSDSITAAGYPGAPTINSAVAGDGSVTVSFNAPSDNVYSLIESYELAYSGGSTSGPADSLNITATGLTNGTEYSFTVAAINGVGKGSPSLPINSTPGVPSPPQNLNSYASDISSISYITLEYEIPANDNGSSIYTYTASWSEDPDMTTIIGYYTPTVPFTDTTMNILSEGNFNYGTPYYFTVQAVNANGTGPASNISNPTIPVDPVAAAPSILLATSGFCSITANWSYPTSPTSEDYSYTVTPYLTVEGTPLTPITGIPNTVFTYELTSDSYQSDPPLTQGVSYYFQVSALYSSGGGTYTSSKSNDVLFAGSPGIPTNIEVVSGIQTITINVEPPSDDGGAPITSYTAKIYSDPGLNIPFGNQVTSNSTSIVIDSNNNPTLVVDTIYYFTVLATNSSENNGSPTSGNAGILYSPPSPPTDVKASFTNGVALITWTPPTGGPPISYYTIVATSIPTSVTNPETADGSAVEATFSGLIAGYSYTFTVTTNTDGGQSSPSASSNQITPTNAPATSPPITLNTPADGTVVVSFVPVSDASEYTAIVYSSETEPTDMSITSDMSPIIFDELNKGTQYWFLLQASNDGGNTYGNVTGPVTPYSAPDPPLNVMGVAGNGQATVSFEPSPNDGGYPVVYYTVYTYENGNQIASDNIGLNTSVVITGLKNEVAYTFTATATSMLPANTDQLSVTDTYLTSIESVPSDPVVPIIVGFTTNPSPYFQNNYATLTYYNTNLNTTDYYVIKDIYGNNISSEATYAYGALSTTFPNFILHTSGLVTIYIFDLTTGQIVDVLEIEVQDICFKEGTQILCCIDKKEKYVPIEKIQEGTFVKVYDRSDSITRGRATYKKVTYIVKNSIFNSEKHTINKLYKLSREKNPRLIDDLYVTGSHALLHSALSDDEHKKMENLIKYYNSYQINIENREEMTDEEIEHFESMVKYYNDYTPMIQDKYKLIAYFDEDFEEICDNQSHNIYHIALENTDKSANYAIYANGVLAETIPESGLYRMKYIDSINEKKAKSLLKPDYITERLNKYAKDKTRVEKIQKEVTKLVENVEKVEDVIVQQLGNRKNKSIRRVKTLLKRKTQRQIM